MIATLRFSVKELLPYINWVYFYHAWGVKRDVSGDLKREADDLLSEWSRQSINALFRVRLLKANALNDTIYLQEYESDNVLDINKKVKCGLPSIPLLRQQHSPFLCLADFFPPPGYSPSTIGLFLSTVSVTSSDLMSQILADRLAEAAAEKGHELTRKYLWRYSPDENLTPKELFAEHYQGKRPAVGYPSLPDQSINFILADLLDFSSLGVELTENGAMIPHSTTTGLMVSHPQCQHFSVGTIGEDQLADYALRRGVSAEWIRKFLDMS
jgi:cobalamin-dependent methionine synthase I